MRVILRICCILQGTSSGLRDVNRPPCQNQCNYNAFSNFRGHISNRTYRRCYWGYVDKSMRVIHRIWSLIRSTSSGLRYVNSVPSQLQYICNAFSNYRVKKSNRTYLRCYWGYVEYSLSVIPRIWIIIQSTSFGLRYVNCVPSQMQCIYSLQFPRPKIWSNVSPLLWVYVGNSMRAIRRIWSLLQNTSSGLSYVNSVPSQLQYICNAFSNYQVKKSNRTDLLCYWGYVENSMRIILHIWSVTQNTSSGLRYVNCVPSQMQCNYGLQSSRPKI
jgi:hypothetical protein